MHARTLGDQKRLLDIPCTLLAVQVNFVDSGDHFFLSYFLLRLNFGSCGHVLDLLVFMYSAPANHDDLIGADEPAMMAMANKLRKT